MISSVKFKILFSLHSIQLSFTRVNKPYIMIPLDIFHENMDNKIIETPLEAWLTFLSSDSPDRIIELITHFPEFKPMYETLYQICLNIERVMNMFSEELRILDRNTVKYMIEEQQQEIDRQKEELAEKDLQIHNLLETQKHAIKNMLQDNMSIEKIATLLGCAISDVEDVKKSMAL